MPVRRKCRNRMLHQGFRNVEILFQPNVKSSTLHVVSFTFALAEIIAVVYVVPDMCSIFVFHFFVLLSFFQFIISFMNSLSSSCIFHVYSFRLPVILMKHLENRISSAVSFKASEIIFLAIFILQVFLMSVGRYLLRLHESAFVIAIPPCVRRPCV